MQSTPTAHRAALRRIPLALAIALGLALPTGAHAQARSDARVSQFAIGAQSLGSALNELSATAGVPIAFAPELVAGRQAPSVQGRLSLRQALERLLAGTGLEAVMDGDTVVVRPAPVREAVTLGSVEVAAPAVFGVTQNLGATVSAGALGDVAQKDTPFSSAVVTNEQILEQASQKLGDLFIQDASVSDNSGTYTAWGTYLTVRGMDLDWQNAYRIDGKPFLGYTVTLPYEHLEQVELLKGATGFMYGFGAPGGMLNYVTKKPSDEPIRDVSLGYSSESIARASVDLGGRAGDTGALGYRFNATHEEGDTVNGGRLRRDSALLALDARLTDRLTWDFQAIYQDRLARDTEPSITLFSYTGDQLPSTIRNSDKLVGPGNYMDNQFYFIATGLSYALNDDWTLQTRFSQSHSKTRRNESVLNLLNADGDYVNDRSDYGERYRYQYWDAMLQGRARTGDMTHHVVAGVSWQKQMNDDSRNWVYNAGAGTGNLGADNDITYESVGSFDSLGLYRSTEVTQKAVFASDRVELDPRWSVLVGLRLTEYERRTWTATGTANTPYKEDGILTPTVALMYKLADDTTAYASYVESLQQGSIVTNNPIYTNAGETLDPLVSTQWELGIKKDSRSWSGTAALFRVEETSEYDESCGVNCLTRKQSGKSIYQGIELGGTMRLSSLWSLGGNLMLLDAQYESGSANDGNQMAGSPRFVATSQLAYRVPQLPGLQLRLGAKYTGRTPLDAANDRAVGGYTLVSLGASYVTEVQGYATTFRASVNNLLDREYWMYQYANYIKAGDPRSINLSATVHF